MFFRVLCIIALIAAVLLALAAAARRRTTEAAAPRPRLWQTFAYLLLLLSILGLALTGLPGVILAGVGSLVGIKLWLHFAAAPVFISMLLVVLIAWGERNRFDAPPDTTPFSRGSRVLFWVMAVCGFVAIAAIVLSMSPFFSSDAQHTLYAVHRYAALFTVAAAIPHAITVLARRRATVRTETTTPPTPRPIESVSH